MTPLKTMDYAFVVNDKKIKAQGFKRGDVVLVTGLKVVPAKRDDPYLQRVLIHVIKVNSETGEHYLPSEKNEHLIYFVDPRSFEKLGESKQEFYSRALEDQYAGSNRHGHLAV